MTRSPSRYSLSMRWYGPATSAVMYDGSRSVGANRQVALPRPTGSGSGVGWLDTTCQSAGAVTVNAKVALRSGCSKTVNIRRESATSNCV